MTAKATYEMVVMFEDEIRQAAKCVRAFMDLPEDAAAADLEAASTKLLQACMVALDGADADGAVLLLGRKPNAA
jgi:hypothetical protein